MGSLIHYERKVQARSGFEALDQLRGCLSLALGPFPMKCTRLPLFTWVSHGPAWSLTIKRTAL